MKVTAQDVHHVITISLLDQPQFARVGGCNNISEAMESQEYIVKNIPRLTVCPKCVFQSESIIEMRAKKPLYFLSSHGAEQIAACPIPTADDLEFLPEALGAS